MTLSLSTLWSRRDSKKATARHVARPGTLFRPTLEALEDRLVPALIVSDISAQAPALLAGLNALPGTTGTQFQVGVIGQQGLVGQIGPVGPQGQLGLVGPQGLVGLIGPAGAQGQIGLTGPQGLVGLIGPQGAIGQIGLVGPQGVIGPIGPVGPQGQIGVIGPQGPIGLIGPAGPQGQVGLIGPQGVIGLIGPQGILGPVGPQGQIGLTGPQGPIGLIGATGATGATGAAGGISGYGYIFNEGAQVVAIEAPVAFDMNGPLLGITHAPGNAGVVVTSSGTYAIDFSVSGVQPGQFALFVNGAAAPGTVYGSGAGTQQDNGQVILTLSANDVLTLVNHSSAAAVTLQTLAGGTQTNVNASLLIEKLA